MINTESSMKTHGSHAYWLMYFWVGVYDKDGVGVSINSPPLHDVFGHADIVDMKCSRVKLWRVS